MTKKQIINAMCKRITAAIEECAIDGCTGTPLYSAGLKKFCRAHKAQAAARMSQYRIDPPHEDA